jgi:sRNA-binding carbon storage regulator CsrA
VSIFRNEVYDRIESEASRGEEEVEAGTNAAVEDALEQLSHRS